MLSSQGFTAVRDAYYWQTIFAYFLNLKVKDKWINWNIVEEIMSHKLPSQGSTSCLVSTHEQANSHTNSQANTKSNSYSNSHTWVEPG